MAQRTKTYRGIKRDNCLAHCYCYYCIGKKFDNNHNRAKDKTVARRELETNYSDDAELTYLIEPEDYHEVLNYV
jgi:hypothetical protein